MVPCCISPSLVPGVDSLGAGSVIPEAYWPGKAACMGAKLVMAGPEKKVGLEREVLLKPFGDDVMSWPGGSMF